MFAALFVCLLACSIARAAREEGMVQEVTKDTFTIKTDRGEVLKFQVGEKLLKDEEDGTRGTYQSKFADLKKGQHINLDYYKKGDTLICTAIAIEKKY
jgi:hypothetical protein